MKSISLDQLSTVTGGAARKLPKLPKLGTKPKFDPNVVRYDSWGAYIGDY